MKRPLLIALIGYIIGIIWEQYFKISIAPFVIMLVIIYIIIKGGRSERNNEKKKDISYSHCLANDAWKICKANFTGMHRAPTIDKCNILNTKTILILIISIIISNAITVYSNNKYKNIYNTSTEEQTYIGTIISEAKEGKYKNTYIIKIESINSNAKYKNIKLMLNISNTYKTKLEYGDKVKFNGTYNAPEVRRNYKGFDYSEYLKTIKVYGIVTCSRNRINILEKENINPIELTTHKISCNIENNIKKLFEQKEAGLLIGILLGNNENIDEDIKEEFRNSGIYHILAVSGAHMSYVILGITYLLDKISISRRKKEILKIIGIIFFMLLTNTSVSVLRAGMMGIITIGASFFYRKKDIFNSVCFSMLIILIYNPYSINSISFQLSYGGVIGILVLNKTYTRLIKKLGKNIIGEHCNVPIKAEAISVILSAQTMIIPIMILNFHTISLTFLFANILVSYIIGIIIILGFICAFISLISLEISSFIAILLNILLKILILIAKFFGNIPLSKIYVTTPSIISIVLYYITIFLNIITCRGILQRAHKHVNKITKLLIILLIITLIFNKYIYIPTNLRIHFIDVGQGDSCLIITPSNKKILIDGGGSIDSSGSYDVGEDTLLPYLLDRGVKTIDYIMVSHFDADHCQGLIAILNSVKVKNIIISKQAESVYNYEKIMEIVIKKKINVMVVKRGDNIKIDKMVELKIIYPEGKLYFDDINSNSIVAKLIYNKFTMLFTGDIESKAEERIVDIAGKELKSTVLKVGHHGSKTSSTEEFIETVKPQIALIGVGKNNKFGHPNDGVLERLKEIGAKIYRTDKNGEITIRINKEGRIWLNKMLN